MRLHLRRHPELVEPSAAATGLAVGRSAVGPVCYLVGVAIALASPAAALTVDALLAGYFLVPAATLSRWTRRRGGR